MRNKTLLITFLLSYLLIGCNANKEFSIKGTADGLDSGIAYLIAGFDNEADTLAQASVKNGSFELKGTVKEVTPALLSLTEQTIGTIPLFIENKEYKIDINLDRIDQSTVSGGGNAQKIADEYRFCGQEDMQAIDDIREEFLSLSPGDKRLEELSSYVDSLILSNEMKKRAFIEANADSYLNIESLAISAQRMTLDELKEAFSKFSPELQKGYSGRNIKSTIESLEKTDIGMLAPDYSLQDPEGETFTIHSIKGKVKLVEFWASWCSPCRAMIPQLKELYKNYHEKGFEILSISMDDDKSRWLDALENEQMPWYHGSDLKGIDLTVPLVKAYNIFGVPHTVLLDENNHILSKRFIEFDELEELIRTNL